MCQKGTRITPFGKCCWVMLLGVAAIIPMVGNVPKGLWSHAQPCPGIPMSHVTLPWWLSQFLGCGSHQLASAFTHLPLSVQLGPLLANTHTHTLFQKECSVWRLCPGLLSVSHMAIVRAGVSLMGILKVSAVLHPRVWAGGAAGHLMAGGGMSLQTSSRVSPGCLQSAVSGSQCQ